MINLLSVILLSALLASCATSLPPRDQRKLTVIKETNSSKNENYSNAITYFSKAFKDSSEVIKNKDKESGRIILKGSTSCNIFRQTGDINNYSLQFTLTFNTKKQKVRFLFEDLFISNNLGEPVGWTYNQLSSPDKVKESKKCLTSLIEGAITSSDSDW